jgi:hypothetical protein
MADAATFAAVAVTFYAAHQAGDYWVQTSAQAAAKGQPGWAGRKACGAHVATYTLTLAACIALAGWWPALPLSAGWVTAGLGVSAATHYIADRRSPLRRIADQLGSGQFWRTGDGLATGAALLDQAWHWFWLFLSALLVTGPPQG